MPRRKGFGSGAPEFNAQASILIPENRRSTLGRKVLGLTSAALATGAGAYFGFTHYVVPWWHGTVVPWWQHTGKWYAAGIGLVGVAGTAAWRNRQRIIDGSSRFVKNQVL